VCNHIGSEKVLDALSWSGQGEWLLAQPSVWVVDKRPAGYVKTHKNLQTLLGGLVVM
jgi:carboxypeptidase D